MESVRRADAKVEMYGQDFQLSMNQPGMVVNPACDQLNRENICLPFLVRS